MDAEKMADMAFTKDELKARKKEMAIGCDGQPNSYPWGLCIRLEKEQLDKLGMKQLPRVGTELHVMAMAKVTSVEQSAREGDEEHQCVALQITHMQMAPEGATEE